jgi:hypothetical protein
MELPRTEKYEPYQEDKCEKNRFFLEVRRRLILKAWPADLLDLVKYLLLERKI